MKLKSDLLNPKFVEFSTSDGLMLPGLLYEAKGSKKAVIYLHGNGSSSVFYDEKEHTDLSEQLNKKSISLLKFNNRGAHIIKRLNVSKGTKVERLPYGCAFEIIKECVLDIDGAVKYLQGLGYKELYLMGASTGANKICVYNHYKSQNIFNKFVMICGGDDTGIYYSLLGDKKFWKLLYESKEKIAKRKGEDLIKSLLPDEIFSYKGFYDIANPDGDYNCFPFLEALGKAKLSKKPLFRYFKEIKKPSLLVYGQQDEFAWGDVPKVVDILKKIQPKFDYEIIKDADHGFTGKNKELAEIVTSWI